MINATNHLSDIVLTVSIPRNCTVTCHSSTVNLDNACKFGFFTTDGTIVAG